MKEKTDADPEHQLDRDMDEFVEKVVKSGEYQNASEAVRDALMSPGCYRLWKTSEAGRYCAPRSRRAREALTEVISWKSAKATSTFIWKR